MLISISGHHSPLDLTTCYKWLKYLLSIYFIFGALLKDYCLMIVSVKINEEPFECEASISNYWQSSFDSACHLQRTQA